MTVAWNGLGPEPLDADEWRAWLRNASVDELEYVCWTFPQSRDAADARGELDRREGEAP